MTCIADLHTHSHYSDGTCSPTDLVASAAKHTNVTHMALSDHNSFAGCQEFLAACRQHNINGLVGAEISGSHPDMPNTELHFLAYFGNRWTKSVQERIELLTPHFNQLISVDHRNIFSFLAAAAKQGTTISYRDVLRKAARFYTARPADLSPALIKPPTFADLRLVMDDLGLESRYQAGEASFESRLWQQAQIRPLPTPSITDAYALFRSARPAVVLAHPMKYRVPPEQMKPYIEQWQQEMGMVAIEAHYAGVLHPAWKALADEMGLLVSMGSDTHGPYHPNTTRVPPDNSGVDLAPLLAKLTEAGN